jgi:hypothetical protein
VKNKESIQMDEFVARAPEILVSIQDSLYARAKEFRDANTHVINSKNDFLRFLHREKPFETRNPRRLCARALERVARNRGTDQERSESHDPRYSAR